MKAIIAIMLLALCSLSYAANTVGGYSQVSSADLKDSKKNANYWSLANFGAEAVVAKARAEKKLSNAKDSFKVDTINSLYQQVVSGVNYKYDVKIVNADKSIVINAKFIVYYQAWTNTKSVTIISYDVVNYKKSNGKRSNVKKCNGKKL